MTPQEFEKIRKHNEEYLKMKERVNKGIDDFNKDLRKSPFYQCMDFPKLGERNK